jgi:hypothetical protein
VLFFQRDKKFYFFGFLPFPPLRFLYQMAKWREFFYAGGAKDAKGANAGRLRFFSQKMEFRPSKATRLAFSEEKTSPIERNLAVNGLI